MGRTIFITGGARSGKSRLAETKASHYGTNLCYLATAQALDDEMGQRISEHQQRRGPAWRTIEEPLNLTRKLVEIDSRYNVILIDCLTIWLSNLLQLFEESENEAGELVTEEVQQLAACLARMTTPVIIVSNEVGMSIVPHNRLARLFRDLAGQANQTIAAASNDVWLVASGFPLRLK